MTIHARIPLPRTLVKPLFLRGYARLSSEHSIGLDSSICGCTRVGVRAKFRHTWRGQGPPSHHTRAQVRDELLEKAVSHLDIVDSKGWFAIIGIQDECRVQRPVEVVPSKRMLIR
jgi:hypothetical protein